MKYFWSTLFFFSLFLGILTWYEDSKIPTIKAPEGYPESYRKKVIPYE